MLLDIIYYYIAVERKFATFFPEIPKSYNFYVNETETNFSCIYYI